MNNCSTNRNILFLKWLLAAVMPFALVFCSGKRERSVTPAMYYWKTEYNLTQQDKSWLIENGIKKLYLRMFDVDWYESLNAPAPSGDLNIIAADTAGMEIIPTVFITNKTFINISPSGIDTLASKIYKKINAKLIKLNCRGVREIQFDCDWSAKSRDNYFNFLRTFKKLTGRKILSATIRLHQVKFFRRTDVPPVDRGMLMFYNMGSVDDYNVKNSIFDKETAGKYLVNFDEYPLPLDVVLPAFSWGALFRNGKLIFLINEPDTSQIRKTNAFTQPARSQYLCTSPVILQGVNIIPNDKIKIETAGKETSLLASEIISPHIKTEKITVALYHLNNEVTGGYEKAVFENIIAGFN